MPQLNWKRIAAVIAFVGIFILLAIAVYFVFFAPSPEQQKPPTAPPPEVGGSLPGRPGELIKEPGTPGEIDILPAPPTRENASAPGEGPVETRLIQSGDNRAIQLGSDGASVVGFDASGGTFYRITPDGATEQLTDQTFKGARTVVFDPSGNKAAIGFYDDSKIVYDFVRKRQVSLPKHWDEFQFSPSGDKLVFKSLSEEKENRWLAIADADGSNGKLIARMGDNASYFMPTWSPSDQIVSLVREGYDADRQKLYFIGLQGENFRSVMAPGRGLETAWSPQGNRLLMSAYSSGSEYKPELWIVDALGDSIGENRRRLNVQTWARKCAFADEETLYCGVPDTLDRGAGIIPARGEDVPHSIYKIDLATGVKEKIAEFPEKHVIGKLIVSSDQSRLYFQERFAGTLHTINLK